MSSIGNEGTRFDSEAFALLTVAPVTAPKVAWATVSSPGAKPTGDAFGLTDGLAEGLGLGLGVGLTLGLGVAVGLATGTVIRLAPVSNDNARATSSTRRAKNPRWSRDWLRGWTPVRGIAPPLRAERFLRECGDP